MAVLVLAKIAATRPLVMRNGVDYERFIRQAAEVTSFWTVITILTAFIWYGLAGQ